MGVGALTIKKKGRMCCHEPGTSIPFQTGLRPVLTKDEHVDKQYMLIYSVSYRIRPNYRTVHLGFSKLQDTLICGQICIYLLRIHYKKRSEKDLFNDDYAIFSDFLYKGICCVYSFELHRLVDAIQMSTHNICLCKEVKKKVHWL